MWPHDLKPPGVVFRRQRWPVDSITEAATVYYTHILSSLPAAPPVTATVIVNHPDAIAVFFALSALPSPCVLVPTDQPMPRPPTPEARLFLAPAAANLAEACKRSGWRTTVLHAPDRHAAGPAPRFLTCEGFVFFSSGSTAAPKPIFRRTEAVLASVAIRVSSLGVPSDGRVLASLPLDRAFGFNQGLLAATILQGQLGLLERFEPHGWFDLVTAEPYDYWATSTAMAEVVTRSLTTRRCDGPSSCIVVGRLSDELARRFADRFGSPLRGHYGATETGSVTTDVAPAELVRAATVGRAHRGVDVLIGDDPDRPVPPGHVGRIWVRSPWLFDGYGVPPALTPAKLLDGWWETPDLGCLDEDGALTLSGRVDDRVKTSAGHLVDLEEVAAVLRAHAGVKDAIVVPIESSGRVAFGALVEAEIQLATDVLRSHLSVGSDYVFER